MAKVGRPKKQIVLGTPKIVRTGSNIITAGTSNPLVGSEFFESDQIGRFPAEIRNPTLNPEMFYLPRFTSNDGTPNTELNSWYDHYYRFDPLIGNLIDLHSTLPVSRFGLTGITDSGILKEFEELTEDLELFELTIQMFKQYFMRGEFFLFSNWDEDKKTFTNAKLLDTNLLTVTSHGLLFPKKKGDIPERYLLEPDQYLQQLVTSTDDFYRDLVDEYLDVDIRDAVENGFQLLIDPFSGSFVSRKVGPWDLRGTSILCNLLKTLMLEDKLREFKYANAQMNTTPIRHWKIGNDQFPADDTMINNWNALITNLNYDPQKNIVSAHNAELVTHGSVGQTDKMHDDLQYIENLKLTALWANKAFTHSEGITYNSATTAMRVLMGRYLPIRIEMENIFYRKIYLPIALSRGYYKRKRSDLPNNKSAMIKVSTKDYKDLQIPLIDWRHKQALMDDQNVRSMLSGLFQSGNFPARVVTDSLDLDYDYVMKWYAKEKGTIFDPQLSEIRKVLLNSAAAGSLKDTGENMVKRVLDANTAFNKAIMGYSPNVELTEKQKEEENKEEKKDYKNTQKSSIDKIKRKYAENIEDEMKKERKIFKPVYSSTDLILKSLNDNYYDKDIVNEIKNELYDIKILLAKEGAEYIGLKTGMVVYEKNPITAQKYLNKVLEFNKEEYNKRLFKVNNIVLSRLSKELSNKLLTDVSLIDFEKYALKYEIPELEIVEKNVLKSHWDNIFANLKENIVDNFIDLIRKTELKAYSSLKVENVYLNGKKESIEKIGKLKLTDKLVPDLGFKRKSSIKFKEFIAKNVPYELRFKVADLVKKHILRGSFDFGKETFETVDNNVLEYHLGWVYDRLNNYNDIVDLEDKFSEGEEDERMFFINQGKKYFNGNLKEEKLKDYFQNIFN